MSDCLKCKNFQAGARPRSAAQSELRDAVEIYRYYDKTRRSRWKFHCEIRKRIETLLDEHSGYLSGKELARWRSFVSELRALPAPGEVAKDLTFFEDGEIPVSSVDPIANLSAAFASASRDLQQLERELIRNEQEAIAEAAEQPPFVIDPPPIMSDHCRMNSTAAFVEWRKNDPPTCSDFSALSDRGAEKRSCDRCIFFVLPNLLDVQFSQELRDWRHKAYFAIDHARAAYKVKPGLGSPWDNSRDMENLHRGRADRRSAEADRACDEHRKLVGAVATDEYRDALEQGGRLAQPPQALGGCLAWGPGFALGCFFNVDGQCSRFSDTNEGLHELSSLFRK